MQTEDRLLTLGCIWLLVSLLTDGCPDNPRPSLIRVAGLLGRVLVGCFFGSVLHHQSSGINLVMRAGDSRPDTVENLEINTFLDGLFHAATYLFVVLGLVLLWGRGTGGPLGCYGMLIGRTLMGVLRCFQWRGGCERPLSSGAPP